MAKYMAIIEEDTQQRIQALPRRVRFSPLTRKAITIFVEEK